MVAVGAVQEGLTPQAVLPRGLEDPATLRVQRAPAVRKPVFQVKAGGGNTTEASGGRGRRLAGRTLPPPSRASTWGSP